MAVDGVTLLTGAVGCLERAYAVAAELERYTVTFTRETGDLHLRAAVVRSDAFHLTQPSLVFVAPHQGGEWRWPVLAVTVTEGALTARLGPRLPD